MGNQYSILLQWSDADQCWWAFAPEFGGRISAHGATRAEALAEMEELLPECVDIFGAEGWPLPTPNIIKDEE